MWLENTSIRHLLFLPQEVLLQQAYPNYSILLQFSGICVGIGSADIQPGTKQATPQVAQANQEEFLYPLTDPIDCRTGSCKCIA